MAEKLLDMIAGEGSTAGILRKQRQAIEEGDYESMHPVVGGKENGEKEENHRDTSKNRSSQVLKRGYFKL